MGCETGGGERSSRRATRAQGEPASPLASRERERGEGSPKDGQSRYERSEEFGPLTVERHRKDDGRALLLYELRGRAR